MAIFRCKLMFVNQQPMPMREKYQMYFQIILQQTERELQFFIIYIGTNCWVISFFACLERMHCKVPITRLKFRHFSWSASSSCLRLVWTAWKCRNLSEEVQGFKYVHVITGHASEYGSDLNAQQNTEAWLKCQFIN